jgi:hypothetical protein
MRTTILIAWAMALLAPSLSRADEDFRPYLFSVDGEVLEPKRVAIESGAGYNGVTGAGGGLQPDDARRTQLWIAGYAGLAPRVELDGSFIFGDDPTTGFGFNQARLDLRVALLRHRSLFPVAISAAVGYQADALVNHALTGSVMATADLGRVQLTVNLRFAHYFAPGRDPIDIFVTAGALVRVTTWLRLGAEYVGEDLEGVDGDDSDNAPGGRHYVGPTVVGYFAHHRLRVNATGGAVLVAGQAGALARGSVAYVF